MQKMTKGTTKNQCTDRQKRKAVIISTYEAAIGEICKRRESLVNCKKITGVSQGITPAQTVDLMLEFETYKATLRRHKRTVSYVLDGVLLNKNAPAAVKQRVMCLKFLLKKPRTILDIK